MYVIIYTNITYVYAHNIYMSMYTLNHNNV